MTSVQNLRGRFIKRARWLVNQVDFEEMLVDAVSGWDADFPSFAIHSRLLAPPVTQDIDDYAYPPRLATRLQHLVNGLLDADLTRECMWAQAHWKSIVRSLSNKAFDSDFFPSYDPLEPTGRFFISYCLVYRQKSIPIGRFFLQRVRHELTTDYMTTNSWTMANTAEANVLLAELQELLKDDPETLARITGKADAAYMTAWGEAKMKQLSTRIGDSGSRVVLPISPAATKSEIHKAVDNAWAEVQEHYGWNLRDQFVRLHNARVTVIDIADYAGVDPSYVRQLLRGPDRSGTDS